MVTLDSYAGNMLVQNASAGANVFDVITGKERQEVILTVRTGGADQFYADVSMLTHGATGSVKEFTVPESQNGTFRQYRICVNEATSHDGVAIAIPTHTGMQKMRFRCGGSAVIGAMPLLKGGSATLL